MAKTSINVGCRIIIRRRFLNDEMAGQLDDLRTKRVPLKTAGYMAGRVTKSSWAKVTLDVHPERLTTWMKSSGDEICEIYGIVAGFLGL